MNNLYLIDYSNFAYKFRNVFKYATRQVSNVVFDNSVCYGFVKALKSNISDNIVICLDGVPAQSLSILPSYKGQRNHDDDRNTISMSKRELIMFLTKIGSLLGKNVKVVCSPCQETDEVIASLVYYLKGGVSNADFITSLNSRRLEDDPYLKTLSKDVVTSLYKPADFNKIVIGSTDGDFIQLQRFEDVYIDLSTSCKKVLPLRESKSTYNTNPFAAILCKSLLGDSSDNVPTAIKGNKAKLVETINKEVVDQSTLDLYYKGIIDRSLLKEFSIDVKLFKINHDVTCLKFRSLPILLDYPTYNIEETINKYGIRI